MPSSGKRWFHNLIPLKYRRNSAWVRFADMENRNNADPKDLVRGSVEFILRAVIHTLAKPTELLLYIGVVLSSYVCELFIFGLIKPN
jgi:hypothetical protein